MKIGFIGLGIMGRPMVKNLLQAGAEVIVSDLNQEAVKDVVASGGKEGSYAEIGAQCDKIIIMVPNGAINKSDSVRRKRCCINNSAGKHCV